MAEPVVHHRGPDFRAVYGECLERLREVCRTEQRRAALHAARGPARWSRRSRTSARPASRVVVVSAGNFGERWETLDERVRLRRRPPPLRVGRDARRRRPARAAARAAGRRPSSSTHSETSTGVVADVQALAAAAKEAGALVVVDAVSSLGAVPLETDAWGIDVVVSGSQKALMTPPGLGARRGLARRRCGRERGSLAALLLRLGADAHGAGRRSTPPFTPAVSLVAGARTSRSGCCSRRASRPSFDRHVRLGRACRAGGEGDGARALLARRGPLRRRHRGPRARGHRRRRARARRCATASASRSPAARAS